MSTTPINGLREIVQEWHRLALPVIGTKDFATTWADFVRGWEKVHSPLGETLNKVLEDVKQDPICASCGLGWKTAAVNRFCNGRTADGD